MSLPKALIDTDTLSALMRSRASVVRRTRAYLGDHGRLTISMVTRFEILRGLLAKSATIQLANFDRFCLANEIVPIDDAIVRRAAAIYADLHRRGLLIGDADILIAATAIEHACVLVSNTTAHIARIPGLILDNWQL